MSQTSLSLTEPTNLPNDRTTGFPSALRFWRGVRRMSQLELALEANVSARHISFLESGRAKPSRAMILQLASALVLPRETQNTLLGLAGFTGSYPATPLQAEVMSPFRDAMAMMMEKHAPWPAMLLDKHWNLLDANDSASAMIATLGATGPHINVLELMCHSPAAEAVIMNLPDVRLELLNRVRLDLLEAGSDPHLLKLEEGLRAALGANAFRGGQPRRVVVPLQARISGVELSFLTAVAHFGTSEDIIVRDLRLELLFPADAVTHAFFSARPGPSASV